MTDGISVLGISGPGPSSSGSHPFPSVTSPQLSRHEAVRLTCTSPVPLSGFPHKQMLRQRSGVGYVRRFQAMEPGAGKQEEGLKESDHTVGKLACSLLGTSGHRELPLRLPYWRDKGTGALIHQRPTIQPLLGWVFFQPAARSPGPGAQGLGWLRDARGALITGVHH